MVFVYEIIAFVPWLVLYILFGGVDFKSLPKNRPEIEMRINGQMHQIPANILYVAAYIANDESKYTIKQVLSMLVPDLVQHVAKKSEKVKPDIATLASCGVLLQNYTNALYPQYKDRIPQQTTEASVQEVVRGFYAEFRDKKHAETVVEACNKSGLINATKVFTETASDYTNVREYHSHVLNTPFAQWDTEIGNVVKEIPEGHCSKIYAIWKRGVYLVFVVSKREPLRYYTYNSAAQKLLDFYLQHVRAQEMRFEKTGKIFFPDSKKEIFAIVNLSDKQKIYFTVQDFRNFCQFYKSLDYSPDNFALFFKRSIAIWLECYLLGLLNTGRDFNSLYELNRYIGRAQEIIAQQEEKTASGGLVFEVDKFIFDSEKIAQRVADHVNFLLQNGAGKEKALEVLKEACDDVGMASLQNKKMHISKAATLDGALKLGKDILVNDFLIIHQPYTPSMLHGNREGRYIICHIKKSYDCKKVF